MFGLGIPELLVIAVIALLIFGPKRLPEMGKSLGSALREFKKGADDITKEVKMAVDIDGLKEDVDNIQKDIAEVGQAVVAPVSSVLEPEKDAKEAVSAAKK